MLTLNLSGESRWVDLAAGARIKVKPLTTALMLAARHDPRALSLTQNSDDAPSEAQENTVALAVAKIIGGLVIEDWEGVGNADGQAVPVSQAWIDALLDLWPMFEAFQEAVVAPAMVLDAEKNVSPPSSTGSSAGAATTAKPARKSAKTARRG